MVDRQRSVLSVPAYVVACCGSPAPDRARSHASVGDENAFDSREQRRPQKSAVGQRREVEAVVLIGQHRSQTRRVKIAGRRRHAFAVYRDEVGHPPETLDDSQCTRDNNPPCHC